MKKIITRDILRNGPKLYASTDCNINGAYYPKYSEVTGYDSPIRQVGDDAIYKLLQNNVLSILPIKAKRVRVINSFPGFDINSEDIIKYLPYREEYEGKWNHKIIFLNDYLEHNGVKIPIDILDTYPTFFEITLVENPEIKEIEYI